MCSCPPFECICMRTQHQQQVSQHAYPQPCSAPQPAYQMAGYHNNYTPNQQPPFLDLADFMACQAPWMQPDNATSSELTVSLGNLAQCSTTLTDTFPHTSTHSVIAPVQDLTATQTVPPGFCSTQPSPAYSTAGATDTSLDSTTSAPLVPSGFLSPGELTCLENAVWTAMDKTDHAKTISSQQPTYAQDPRNLPLDHNIQATNMDLAACLLGDGYPSPQTEFTQTKEDSQIAVCSNNAVQPTQPQRPSSSALLSYPPQASPQEQAAIDPFAFYEGELAPYQSLCDSLLIATE